MSPNPEFYLKNLLGHDRVWEEIVKKWSETQFTHNKSLLLCNLDIKGQTGDTLPLKAIIKTHWGYLGCGELVIPTSIVYRTDRAKWETPGLVKLASWNVSYVGEGYIPQVFPLLGIGPSAQSGEIDIKKDAVYYSVEQTNQNVTEIHGIVFGRDIHKLSDSWKWRSFSGAEDPKLEIISAMGLIQSLKAQFPTWDITPGFFPS